LSYDLTFGRRLWDFSYVTVGYQHRPLIHASSSSEKDDGPFEEVDTTRSGVLAFGFGWNSEDDAYFPTRGSRLDVSVIAPDEYSHKTSGFYRRNWRWGRTIWTAHYQSDDIFGISVARPLAPWARCRALSSRSGCRRSTRGCAAASLARRSRSA
jgi:hypothetical protein